MMTTTFITNIRYGELPVRKVYLGEKLIWQCDIVQGYAESTSFAKAYFNSPILDLITGQSQSTSQYKSNMNILELTLVRGELESSIYTKSSTMQLFNLLSASGYATSKSNMKVIGDVLDTILLNGEASVQSNGLVVNRLSNAGNMQSAMEIKHIADGAGAAMGNMEHLNGNVAINSVSDTFGNIIGVIDINSSIQNTIVTKNALVGCLIPVKVIAWAESTSCGDSALKVFDAMLVSGNANAEHRAEAIYSFLSGLRMHSNVWLTSDAKALSQLFGTSLMQGEAESYSDGEGVTIQRRAIQCKDWDAYLTSGDSFIGKYLLIVSNGNSKINTNASASPILWYPPIGDGIPLVANDGIDITQNGDILEIQQAYQINIDDENKTLEVI